MKWGIILDEGPEQFALEYEDTLGRKNRMRLDARTYERAISEARSFLGIDQNERDPAGDQWVVE